MSRFKRGNPGGPGRPKGSASGRHAALLALDRVLAEEQNLERLEQGFRRELEQDPIRFWRTIVAPLLPKQTKLEIGPTEEERLAIIHEWVQGVARETYGTGEQESA